LKLIALLLAVGALAAWNPVVNGVLPAAWYVPANLAVAGGLLALARVSGLTPSELGLGRGAAPGGVRLGLLLAAVVAVAIALALALPATRGLFADRRLAGIGGSGLAYQALVRVPLGTVVLEELAFRGVLLALAARLVPTPAAVVLSSALFGLWHVLPAASALRANELAAAAPARIGAIAASVVVTAVVGVLFCALRLRSGSLLAPALVHVATNSLASVAAFIALRTA
jgi:membrane protease YdiL (CAAX protease family)